MCLVSMLGAPCFSVQSMDILWRLHGPSMDLPWAVDGDFHAGATAWRLVFLLGLLDSVRLSIDILWNYIKLNKYF